MSQMKHQLAAGAVAVACAVAFGGLTAHADRDGRDRDRRDDRDDNRVRKVFVIAMENHNWTQPNPTSSPQQIFMNPAAPYINSLVNGTSGISDQVSYATNYQAAMIGLHPSEPNYVWVEAGDAGNSLGTDADPFSATCADVTNLHTDQHLTAFLNKRHRSWKSYQEDVNVDLTTNVPLPQASWLSPIASHSGNFTLPAINAYNYSTQYNYAAKHNPQIFFQDTNLGCPAAHTLFYPPLQQLALDLQSGDVADYTWITPNQFNDQHSILKLGYGSLGTTDQAAIAQGDNFLARVVPLIMASDAYRDGAAILIWSDETEGGDTAQFTIPFIVISRNAHANDHGKPFASAVKYSHSSFLRTMQEVFDVDPDDGFPFLGDAINATDLRALFKPGAIK
jgi:phosphatidylinositol-3-phosphatase